MGETHEIIGPAAGEPLQSPRVGASIRVPLDSPPTGRWSDMLSSHLANSLTGHVAVGHLRLNHLVQGSVIVLDGVEEREAEVLGPALREAIDAANNACEDDPHPPEPANMDQGEADRLAEMISRTTRR
jgi:hypothetical protein